MQNIALPKNITFQDGEQPFQKFVVVDPLFSGYGITLGNSLRRVLLSSLSGTAVVGVKIKGADHEFMALSNIKEDVLDIVLNLKQLAMKIHSDEVIRLELEARGEKIVKASDIKANSDVEIINKDLVLAHITDPAGVLEMEIFITKGMGYETIENRTEKSKEIGYIEIDSIFSPVKHVGINVENVRVGKMTNWDKLTLEIITDGTIDPKDAFESSVHILLDQFNALLTTPNQKEEAGGKEEKAEEENIEEDTKEESEEKEDEEKNNKKKTSKKDK